MNATVHAPGMEVPAEQLSETGRRVNNGPVMVITLIDQRKGIGGS